MGDSLFRGEIEIFHGTSHYFTDVNLNAAQNIEGRQAMDQYGIGFYTAATPSNAQIAADYAATYANGNGMLLSGQLQEGSFALLNLDEPIGSDIAANLSIQLQKVIESPDTPEDVKRYLTRVMDNIDPDMSGSDAWNAISSEGRFEAFLRSEAIPDSDTIKAELKAARAEIFSGEISLMDLKYLNDSEQADFRSTIEAQAEKPGPLQPHFKALLEDSDDLFNPDQYMEARFAQKAVNLGANSIVQDRLMSFPPMDYFATQTLEGAKIDGLYIPSEDTVVWKGEGVKKLPEFQLERVIGNGPNNAPESLQLGDKVINAGTPSIPEVDAPETDAPKSSGGGADGLKHLGVAGGAALTLSALFNGNAAEAAEIALRTGIDMAPLGGVVNEATDEQRVDEMGMSLIEDGIGYGGAILAGGAAVAGGVAATPAILAAGAAFLVADAARMGANLAGFDVDPSMIQVGYGALTSLDFSIDAQEHASMMLMETLSSTYMVNMYTPGGAEAMSTAVDLIQQIKKLPKEEMLQQTSNFILAARIDNANLMAQFVVDNYDRFPLRELGVESSEELLELLSTPEGISAVNMEANGFLREDIYSKFLPLAETSHKLVNEHAYLVQLAAEEGVMIDYGQEKPESAPIRPTAESAQDRKAHRFAPQQNQLRN